ncbi:fungal-specific transcription factor domain-containing protein [Cytidiella melzeri]|nr:fungal-specific transcription factor domain-containing protein [Cytidiella melzeri]
MALPKAQDIVVDLRTDRFAKDILDRVKSGPYGSVGRSSTKAVVPGEDGFYTTIMSQSASDDRRSKRQSRQSREFVSSQDGTASAVPTPEWQEQLYRRLSSIQSSGMASPATQYSTASSSEHARFPSYSSSSGQPARRRRIDAPISSIPETDRGMSRRSRESVESIHESAEEYDEATDAFGHLSVDQNHEFRYHGRSAGLHLLAKSDRRDDSQQQENGIWKFDDLKMTTDSLCLSFDKVNDDIQLPDYQTQDQLIMAYFSYVHHIYPVVHKASFLAMYNERTLETPDSGKTEKDGRKRESLQTVTKLLLLAMFALAAHYLPPPEGMKPHEAGNKYAVDARRLINTLYADSRPSTCQALVLLGLRELGVASLSQGWMFIGMGARMAIDLGMNRDADNWKDASGHDLFTAIEKQTRRQIWWSCCIADKMSAVWLGRPVMFKKGDFSIPEPDFDINDDEAMWRPYPRNLLGAEFSPMPARVMVCFKMQCKLSILMSEIMAKLYPVKLYDDDVVYREKWRNDLENRLHQWLINLPEELAYREGVTESPVSPHVLILHVEYHGAILLLHRAFLPNWSDQQRLSTQKDHNLMHSQCLDVCQSAATRISSLIDAYDKIFSLKRAPPLLASYLQSSGIMHVVTLTRRPRDTQATIGLMQSIRAAEVIEDVWPEATRTKNLLRGACVDMDDLSAHNRSSEGRPKRGLQEVLGGDRSPGLLHQYSVPHIATNEPSSSSPQNLSSPYAMFADEGIQSPPSSAMSYVPGYEWWPQLIGPGTGGGYVTPDYGAFQLSPMGSQLVPPQGLFTFDQNQLTSDFMQEVGAVSGQADGPTPSGQLPQQQAAANSSLMSLQRHLNPPHEHYGLGYPPT